MSERFACFIALLLLGSTSVSGDDLFNSRIGPILESRCVNCHNDNDRKGELSLQSLAGLAAGGESGPVVERGDPDASSLVEYISGQMPEMPKNDDPLKSDDIDAIRRWITAGAEWPDGAVLENRSLADLDWWSLA